MCLLSFWQKTEVTVALTDIKVRCICYFWQVMPVTYSAGLLEQNTPVVIVFLFKLNPLLKTLRINSGVFIHENISSKFTQDKR